MRKVGLAIFFVFFIITSLSGIDDFMAGLSGKAKSYITDNPKELIFNIEEQNQLQWTGLVGSILSLLVYILSKEKVEDEFLSHLRADSMVKAVGFSWGFYFAIKPLNWTNQFEGLVILQLQILAYILIYTYQKKWKHWV
jgi:hypothetical protein